MSVRWSGAVRLTAWAWFAALLGCVALAPLVDDDGFLLAGAFAGALVAATGALCRLGHLPAPVIVPLQLLVLLEWLTLTYVRAQAWAGLFPTGESTARLAEFVRSALELARVTVPPAPVDTAAGACLAAIVALVVLVVDLVAVTWRRPALVGLVLLGVYMAPVSLLAGNVSAFAFIPGALGYVFLLAAEQRDRLSHWGRQITSVGSLLAGSTRSTPTVTSLVSAGRRVGFGAVALAVVLPVLIPTLPRTLLGDGPLTVDGRSADGNGDGSVEVDNPLLDLKKNLDEQSPEVLITFSTDDPDPGYLRLAALDTFTGDSWEPGPRPDDTSLDLGQTPIVPGLSTQVVRERISYDVQFSDRFQSTWLPTVYPAIDVRADDNWGIDSVQLDVSAREGNVETPGQSYSFTSLQITPSRNQFATADESPTTYQPFVDLPPDLPPEIGTIADDVTADARTPIDQALALQQWFREDGGFRYSLDRASGDGLETIREFLTDNRTGYCEQFAASMALMARSLNIPARVAVGFLRPESAGDGRYSYRGTDMHAWPELYFGGVGWVRFEPTPAVRSGEAPTYSTSGAGGNATTTTAAPGETQSAAPTRGAPGDVEQAAGGGGGSSWTGPTLGIGLGLLALLVLALAPRLVRGAVRRRRWARAEAGPAEPAWQELRDTVVDLGFAFDDRATLRIAGRGLRGHLSGRPEAVDALNRLVVVVERSRFARAGGSVTTGVQQVRADVDTVLAALAAGRNRRRLLRATWLPRSLVRRVGSDSVRSRPGRPVIGSDGAVVRVEGTAAR